MLSRYDPKSLAKWIELDFFQRPSRLRRARRLATWLCVLAALIVVGIGLIPSNHAMYEAGPLSPAHGHITDCAVCHSEPFSTVRRLWPGNSTMATVPDSACTRCHDPGPHHPAPLAGALGCSSCHHEHHGAERLAGHVRDAQCTSCHADLKAVTDREPVFANVTNFPSGHPDFKLFRDEKPRDPGTIRFRHDVHLQKDGVPIVPTGPQPMKDLLDRGDVTWKKLDCASCHESDDTGRYFKPINYTKQCAGCHPLSVRVDGVPKKEAEAFARTPAPHVAPELVRAELRSRLFDLAVRASQSTPDDLRDHPLPGRRRPLPASEPDRQWVNRQLEMNERLLFDLGGGCRFCHQETTDPAQRPNGLPEFAKSNMPERWFADARFRHQSHRMNACTDCHAMATSSTSALDVLIPSADNCKQCHNPKAGVRSDCIGCHDYHHAPQRTGLSGPKGDNREPGQR